MDFGFLLESCSPIRLVGILDALYSTFDEVTTHWHQKHKEFNTFYFVRHINGAANDFKAVRCVTSHKQYSWWTWDDFMNVMQLNLIVNCSKEQLSVVSKNEKHWSIRLRLKVTIPKGFDDEIVRAEMERQKPQKWSRMKNCKKCNKTASTARVWLAFKLAWRMRPSNGFCVSFVCRFLTFLLFLCCLLMRIW